MDSPDADGLTLDELAAAVRLPASELRFLGLAERRSSGRTVVAIPYRDADGRERAVQYQQALVGRGRFYWRKGDRPVPYGLDRLEEARTSGWLLIVRGLSDCWTAWHYGIPALGITGNNLPADLAPALDGLTVYIWQQPGDEDFSERVGHDLPDARIVVAPDGVFDGSNRFGGDIPAIPVKDLTDAHVQGIDVSELLERLKASATPYRDILAKRAQEDLERNEAEAHSLLTAPDLLDRVGQVMRARGYAGDLHPPLTVYVAMTSRLLERPQNVAVVSQSAAGKNRTVDAAAELMPPEALYIVKASSAHALIYTDEDFHERVVVFSEADSIPDDGPAASAVRSLAEDNAMDYDVVERDEATGQQTVRHIHKPGPTGLITTSTRSLQNQLGTRVLELNLAEDEEQTRAVLRAQASHARRPTGELPDVSTFHALQRSLAASPVRQVDVPYADILAGRVPAKTVRMRRDFRQLLTCIQTIALLYQRQRGTVDGWVVATIEDYAMAYGLLSPVFDTLAAEGLTPVVRKTVEAVKEGEEAVTEAELVRRLNLAKSTVHWRVARAIRGGWLVNGESRRGFPAKLSRGAPMPEDTSALPSPKQLREVWEGSGVDVPRPSAHGSEEEDLGGTSTPKAFEPSNGPPSQASDTEDDGRESTPHDILDEIRPFSLEEATGVKLKDRHEPAA